MSLTILIPTRNEQSIIGKTIENITKSKIKDLNYEIIIVNDFSKDNTSKIVKKIKKKNKRIKIYKNSKPGLGSAIKVGVKKSIKEYVCIYMADQSDSVTDLIKYYKLIKKNNLDAVFGSRFVNGSKVKGYPLKKLFFNRIFNNMCKIFFLNNYNDYTNAFKIYKKEILISFFPIVSENFNVFLELPLKTVSEILILLFLSHGQIEQRNQNL